MKSVGMRASPYNRGLGDTSYATIVRMASTEPSPEDLEASREQRVARQQIGRQQALVSNLRAARRLRVNNGLSPALIDPALQQAEDELVTLLAVVGGSMEHRKRPKVSGTESCAIYLDECGAHPLASPDSFGAFVLAAVIVRDQDADVFEAKWKRWKLQQLGSETSPIHEPDVRKRKHSFRKGGNSARQAATLASLAQILKDLEYSAVVCVLDRPKYLAAHGVASMDESLPNHGYLMTLHFMAERLAMALQHHFGGAKGRLILEARGSKEDAELQYEFARLFLDGTSYLAPDYFRRQFLPGLLFKLKNDHVAGLEVADLIARPCGEKVLAPTSTPDRWPEVRTKLCQGVETKHSILGLKMTPWDDAYIDLWKS